MANYLIFGDSIGLGEGDPAGGWAKLLSEKYSVKNLSIDGATTDNYVKSFPANINKNAILLIALGVNDSVLIPLKKFQQNLIQLIKLARKYTRQIIFVGPGPVNQPKVDPAPWPPHLSYKNDLIKKYNRTIAAICQKEKLLFIDLFNNLPSDYITELNDGLHPNHAGHQMIFTIIKSNL